MIAPFVRGDTLYGRLRFQGDTIGVSVAAVRSLERERLSIWRTLGAAVAPVTAFLAVFVIACAGDDCDAQPTF